MHNIITVLGASFVAIPCGKGDLEFCLSVVWSRLGDFGSCFGSCGGWRN